MMGSYNFRSTKPYHNIPNLGKVYYSNLGYIEYRGLLAFKSYRDEPFQIGLRIAKLLTYSWNLQQNPPKVHIFDRRIHHGEIGLLLELSSLFKKYPIPAGILTGIGWGLVKDDYGDIEEWFRFKKNIEKKGSKL